MRLKTIRYASRRLMVPILLSGLGTILFQRAALSQHEAPLSLTLSQAMDLALKQNRNLKLAQLAIVDKEYKKEIARSSYFPHIKNESSVLHVTELAGVEIPAGAFGVHAATGAIPSQNLFLDQGALTSYTSGTGLAQPLTQMFRIHEANRAATADIQTAKIQATQEENEIILQVRQLYDSILIAQLRQQAAAEEIVASQIKMQESTEAVERGRSLDVVALESHTAFLEARQAALVQKLQIHDLTVTLDDLLGLPLTTELQLNTDVSATSLSIPSLEECIRIAHDQSPEVKAAEQAVVKAKAGISAAKYAYIPDITALARYSYQSGVPLLVHNFGTFGFSLSYDLFDGGKRSADIKDSQTLLSQAQLNLDKIEGEIAVQVEKDYDKVEQLQNLVSIAEETLQVRTEAARLADRQFEQNEVLASIRSEAHAKVIAARASSLEANLGLSLAQNNLKRTMGQQPR